MQYPFAIEYHPRAGASILPVHNYDAREKEYTKDCTNVYVSRPHWNSNVSSQQFYRSYTSQHPTTFDSVCTSYGSGSYDGKREQQAGQGSNEMIPGIFDARVHHRYRKQANFESWFEDDPDWLLGCICPADLCDVPCQWDEVNGCQMFRLCQIRQKYPHPRYGQRPPCDERTRHMCDGIHDIIEPTCRSLGKQVSSADSRDWQFRDYQACEHVARLASLNHADTILHCRWGHDYEAARIVAIWMYWVHTALACRLGARGRVQRRDGVCAWVPLQPDLDTLHDLRIIDNGAVEGLTFHNHKVVLPWDVYRYFLDRHQRRSLSVGCPVSDSKPVEELNSDDEDYREEWLPRLRRAASFSCQETLTEQKPRIRTRSGSMSV